MSDLNSIVEPQSIPPRDSNAQRELDAFYSDKKRKERVKNVINWIFIVFIVLTGAVGLAVISVRLVHLVLPACRQWLTTEQIQGIDKLFFSGAIGGVLVTYFKKSSE